jgi:SAM-dependent methyltransferase
MSNTQTKFTSPYMHELVLPKPYDQKRTQAVIFEFIGERNIGKALDIGARNQLTETLEKHFSSSIENTNIDLDIGHLTGQYNTVFCFEVLEHLFNPLHFLFEVYKVLSNDGRFYLSTPKARPHFLWFKHHFHEFHQRELINLIKRSGFEIARMKYYRTLPIWHGFTGFRPFLRLLLQRKCLLELRK